MGVITWDFPNITMEFQWNGDLIWLTADKETHKGWREGSLSGIHEALGLMVVQQQVQPTKGWELKTLMEPEEVKSALARFSMVFEEPKTLPPRRRHDHAIPLEAGVNELSLRPYRYSMTQKDIIEKLVEEMLKTGVYRTSTVLSLHPWYW